MSSLKNILGKCLENPWKVQRDFNLEVMEIHEIAEKLFIRIDQKIKELKTVEAQADEKIILLHGLINESKQKIKGTDLVGVEEKGHQQSVQSLFKKGFSGEQIARILDLPSGEVELILNLARD